MSINLNPDVEARLRALANANGVSLEAFLQQIADQKSPSSAKRLSPDEWAQKFEEWADSFSEAPPIPDDALSRENLYPDR